MANSINAAYKYKHDDDPGMHWVQLAMIVCGMIAAAFMFIMSTGAGIFSMVFWLVLCILVWPKRKICLYPRYFICGDTIIYYRRINKLSLSETAGVLDMDWGSRKSFRLERERFPTNARKPAKIAKNKNAKFTKVAGKIIEKVLSVKPDVELAGIERPSIENQQ